ncbi:ABC-F type ribosomal protection protein [Microbacterium sp. APC 3898]|uniref:Ribosome protection protein VmlR n=1 Tax=Planococcus notacanthi TaxID=3035188 RepID=A0ABT7ZJM7_9BACL|nr:MULTISPECIES: ABC-F type ribosomal protection protein [Terrabacteria group]MDN3427360.1 ABC-F type ribosomal protection protein [Planococcus sp. APC 4016]MDN3499644.1 ABC-F type ribosomal protection protein [Microbacterium sp. APC 3898]
MKELLKLHNVRYEIKEMVIFEEVNASVQQGDVIGIIGKNGAGKSTLLRLIAGELAPSSGQLDWLQPNLETVFVEQETETHSFGEVSASETVLLHRWQVPEHDFSLLSGGEKLKVRLSAGFAQNAHLLLLDEPTNHLDGGSIELLMDQIRKYPGTLILVSHNRHFLDAVATKIWSLENRKLIEHRGNYSSYMEARQQKRLAQQREYDQQQKMVGRIEAQMDELTSWSHKAHAESTKQEGYKEHYRLKAKRMDKQVKSKQKRLEKELEKINAEPLEPEYEVNFSMKATHKTGKRFLEAKGLSKSFDGKLLFDQVDFTILHGEKVAIEGPNGSGKTTLLKILLGQETADGEVWMSPSASVGYLTQEVFDLPLEKTPAELFYKETFEARGKVQNLMKHLGFTVEQWNEPISAMSMGERIKCKLMLYILEERDALILDEPTNHLDLPSREQLEETLSHYTGTLLVVSHDQAFREKTTTSKLVIADHRIEKQLDAPVPERDDTGELLMRLETERQEVLGKLSFMAAKDPQYRELDRRFNELTQEIKKHR